MNSKINDLIGNVINSFSNFFDSIGKVTVSEYENMICDYIEKLIKVVSEKERVKCFGGNCIITYNSAPVQATTVFKTNSTNEVVLKEIARSEITLYFKDINDKWITKNTVGNIEISKFDINDAETRMFINKIKSGTKVEHKINQ